jgi:hypothetical protein
MQAQSRNESMAIHLISIDRRLTRFSSHNFFAERDLGNDYIIELMVTSNIFAQKRKGPARVRVRRAPSRFPSRPLITTLPSTADRTGSSLPERLIHSGPAEDPEINHEHGSEDDSNACNVNGLNRREHRDTVNAAFLLCNSNELDSDFVARPPRRQRCSSLLR